MPAGVAAGSYNVLVTTPGGTSTGGPTLTVTTPATMTPVAINCTTDANQNPMLATFTNGSLLTPSAWNEFLYSGRGYAAVFGHTSNKSLPTMEFFAPAANGTYALTANLYGQHGRTYRYYWGTTAASPLASSVDVATQSDFAVKSLGNVVVTNSQASIFIQRADVVSGTDYYFGWASLTLTPISPPTYPVPSPSGIACAPASVATRAPRRLDPGHGTVRGHLVAV